MQRLAARVLTPSSLSLEPGVDANSPREASELEPGDIVLLRTPGAVYQAFRQFSASEYDHVVVALSRPDQCLHISPPTARRVRTRQLLVDERQPRVLRPRISDEEKKRFVQKCESLLGSEYSLYRLYGNIVRTVAEKQFRVGRFLPKLSTPTAQDQAWVCTDAILVALLESAPSLKRSAASISPALDIFRTGSASIADLLRLEKHKLLEDVFILVEPSPPQQESTAEKLRKAWDQAGRTKISLRTLGFALLISSWFNRRLFFFRLAMILALIWAYLNPTNRAMSSILRSPL